MVLGIEFAASSILPQEWTFYLRSALKVSFKHSKIINKITPVYKVWGKGLPKQGKQKSKPLCRDPGKETVLEAETSSKALHSYLSQV